MIAGSDAEHVGPPPPKIRSRSSAPRVLMAVWVGVGMLPLLLQGRSYLKFAMSHKLAEDLVAPVGAARQTANVVVVCPVEWLFIANALWNVAITHYYSLEHGNICHFVIPQYNIHGSYTMGTKRVNSSSTTPASCSGESYPFEHYLYHGSIGYYAFYEEAVGTYCAIDKTAYVQVYGLGAFDSNAAALAKDRGDYNYRQSYWYGCFGLLWIVYRILLLRRSFILCKRYGRRYANLHETLSRKSAIVFMQESMRLATYDTTNYHRVVILYMLTEGVMSDLFLLIAQDGLSAKIQYISLGYNLSGVLSLLFEMLENTHWLRENVRLLLKRLLFNYETCLLGELLSAGILNYYLTWINRSSLKDTRPAALAVSYYVWSLVGHGILVLGLTAFITTVRVILSSAFICWRHRTWAVLTAPCCVDTTLGMRCKMIMLGGYVWEDDKLYYKSEALKAFGVLKMIEEDGAEYFVFRRVHSLKVPRNDLLVIGSVDGHHVKPCTERLCTGPVTMFYRYLGGPLNEEQRKHILHIRSNKVHTGPRSALSSDGNHVV